MRAIVIGAGIVGLSIAAGMAARGAEVVVLDSVSDPHRASMGNAGLVWVQGKGIGAPAYARWTRASADQWPGFAAHLLDETGIDVEYRRPGGFNLCIGEAELDARAAAVARLARDVEGANGTVMVDRDVIRARLPDVGPEVVGASWSPHDGHVNPLLLLRALHALCTKTGVTIVADGRVHGIAGVAGAIRVDGAAGVLDADRVVIAAGLNTGPLAKDAGLEVPLRAVRGQIVVTERIPSRLAHPTPTTRQAVAGTILFGNSHEEGATEPVTTLGVLAAHARRALAEFPFLADLRVIRSWGALRVMPRDGRPIYDQSRHVPGIFVAACHSGITLAAVHYGTVGPAMIEGTLPYPLRPFSLARFDVQDTVAD